MRTNRWLIVVCIIAVFCLVIGGGFVLMGKAMGGQGRFMNNKWGINFGPVSISSKRYDGPLDNETISLDSFELLELDLSMVEVEVKQGIDASLELINIPSNTMKTSMNGNVLRIYNKYDNHMNYDFGHITNKAILTLPEKEFEKVDIELAMGMLKIQSMKSKELTIQSSMTAIDINDLTTSKLDIESSMADVDVTGSLSGEITIESSMGNVEVTILGKQDAYAYDLSNSMGSIKYAGESIDGFNSNATGNKDAVNNIKIGNSMGNIDVRFR